jgi:hypothetical protein
MQSNADKVIDRHQLSMRKAQNAHITASRGINKIFRKDFSKTSEADTEQLKALTREVKNAGARSVYHAKKIKELGAEPRHICFVGEVA